MKKFLALLLCGSMFSATIFAKEWTLQGEFEIDIDDTVSQMLVDLGIDEALINEQLEKSNIDLKSYGDEWDAIKGKVKDAISEYADTIGELQGGNIIPTVRDGFDDFSKSLIYAVQDSSTLSNTESAAWIGSLIPGFHFRLGVDASLATLDIDPLLTMTSALGWDLDLSDITDTIKDTPVIGKYDHHLVFPSLALNARLGGLFLPFDIGFSLMSLDTRGDLESVWPSDIGDKLNINYLTLGLDLRYKLWKIGFKMLNMQVAGLTGVYMTKGDIEASVDEGSAAFDFSQISGTLGLQATAHALFLDVFVGAKLVTNFYSKVSLKARPNWKEIMEFDDERAREVAVALMPEEIGFEAEDGWGKHFELNPVFYGGIGLSAKIVRLGVGASYNMKSENLGATVNVRFAW